MGHPRNLLSKPVFEPATLPSVKDLLDRYLLFLTPLLNDPLIQIKNEIETVQREIEIDLRKNHYVKN